MKVYVSKDGQQYGPYTNEQIQEVVRQGNFTTADLACYDGQNWVTIAEIPGFTAGGDSVTTPQQPQAVQEQAVSTGIASKKKKILLWSSIWSAATALAAGMFFWFSDSGEPRQARQREVDYFSWPIEESDKFQKGATIVASVTGEVSIIDPPASKDSNSSSRYSAKENDVLPPGTQVQVGAGSEAILLFSNGTTATVGANTKILIEAFVQEEFDGSDKKVGELLEEVSPSRIKLDLDFGEMIMDVKKLNKGSTLVISSTTGTAGIRGTQFMIVAKEDATAVSVFSGSVDFLDVDKAVRPVGNETRLVATKGAPPKQTALPPAVRSRIETANQAASKKMALLKLQKLTKAYEEVNQRQSRYDPKIMGSRCDPKMRVARLRARGGKDITEQAIIRGLTWLKNTQAPNGSWGGDAKSETGETVPTDKNAMTGMALLCFLGHCELQDSPEFGSTVQKAIAFLTSTPPETMTGGGGGAYSHPIRTDALCTAYSMTKIQKLEPWVKTATETIIKGQNESGGWAYGYSKGPAAHVDLSVTGWNVDALKAAALTGLVIEGLDEAMDKAVAYVKRCQDKSGRFAYKELPPNSARGGKPSLTGMGVRCLQIWKNAESKEAEKGLDWIIANQATEWSEVNVYEWHRSAMACFQANGVNGGRKYWTAWNKDFQDIVCGAQLPDGQWPSAVHFHGETDLFRTTMTIRMLEVFYQYIPSGG